MAIDATERPTVAAEAQEPTVTTGYEPPQYSRRQIVAVWAAATLPMGVAAWIAAPLIAGTSGAPDALPKALLVTLSIGLVWQFVLVVFLVYREQATLRWSRVRQVLWLRPPRSLRTGRQGGWLWLIPVLMVLGLALIEAVPSIPHPVDRDLAPFLGTPAGHAFLHGAWGWLAVIGVLVVFNTVLGEESLFRGLLLPRMNRVFGRFDWLANGVLFALYHVHVPWTMCT